MNDSLIIDLFFKRDENAIAETQKKYGSYCYAVANNILASHEDSEECVNDTYIKAWDSIPPCIPQCLRAFLSRITRNLAFNRYKQRTREKRGGGEITLALDELGECVAGSGDVEREYLQRELYEYVNKFLHSLPERECDIFLCRYYFVYSTSEIAKRHDLKEDYVRTVLSRTRKRLREYLTENKLI